MTTLGPGFIDKLEGGKSEPSAVASEAVQLSETSGPMLLNSVPGEVRTRIAPLWEPELIKTKPSGNSPATWVAGGLIFLLLSWLLLSLSAFVVDQFHRSPLFGVLTLISFGIALSMVSYGLSGELRAWFSLRRVTEMRQRLRRSDLSLSDLRAGILPWLRVIRHQLEDPERIMTLVENAASPGELRAVLGRVVVGPLQQAARQAGRRAALEGGAVVAITPAPALEGALAGLRGLLLVRQVAGIYGVRPGFFVTLALLRRVAWTAAGVSGFGLLSQTLAEHTLHKLPFVKHLSGALPETSLAAIRLYRLANITAEACSPIPEDGDK